MCRAGPAPFRRVGRRHRLDEAISRWYQIECANDTLTGLRELAWRRHQICLVLGSLKGT